jgi:MFS family permease
VWQLIALQGIVFGLAAGALYAPIIMWLSEWFVQRRSLAGGIIFGGSGTGGFVLPLAIGACLEKVGLPWTMRICALILGVGCSLALLGTNPRIPVRKVGFERRKPTWPALRWDFFKNPLLLWMLATNMVQALGFFPVSVFISTYTSAVTSSTISPTVALSLFNAASVICFIIFGRLCDSYPYPTVMLFSGLGSALGAFFLWGFATNISLIFSFALVYGGLSGGFSSVWPAAATEIAGSRNENTSLAVGIFGVVRGVAAIVGPIIAASLRNEKAIGTSKYGAHGYRSVEIFVGAMAFATAAGAVGVSLKSKAK